MSHKQCVVSLERSKFHVKQRVMLMSVSSKALQSFMLISWLIKKKNIKHNRQTHREAAERQTAPSIQMTPTFTKRRVETAAVETVFWRTLDNRKILKKTKQNKTFCRIAPPCSQGYPNLNIPQSYSSSLSGQGGVVSTWTLPEQRVYVSIMALQLISDCLHRLYSQ